MGLPGVSITKVNANAGTVPPSATGVAAIVAPCSGGSAYTNVATAWNSPLLVQQTYLVGPLVEFPTYEMTEAELPVVVVKPTTTTAASCSSVTASKTGTFVPSVTTTTAADDYNAVVTESIASPMPSALAGNVAGVVVYFVVGGALGTAGIQYVISLDGGNSVSPIQSLGTALTISPTEPVTGGSTGLVITLGTATQTVIAGDYFWFTTVGPRMGTADITAALQALYVSKQPFDLVLIHGETSAAIIAIIEAWVLTMNATGRYPTVLVNTRFKGQIPGSVETETAYATAMTTIISNVVANDVCCGADGAAYVSPLTGVTKAMPTSLYVLATCEANPVGVDPALKALGALGNADIDNPHLTPAFHDENVTNTLDATGGTLRLSTLRSWFGDSGAFITNAYLLSSQGSDYVYIQDNRTMNAAASVAFQQLTQLCSSGVPRNLSTGFILEPTAAAWEQLILTRIAKAVSGQVSGIAFAISRTDPLTGNGPQTIHATLSNDALAYVKSFAVTAEFVNTLT